MHKSFLIKLSILTLILAAAIFVLDWEHVFAGFQSFVWMSLVFLVGITIVVYLIMHRAMAMK